MGLLQPVLIVTAQHFLPHSRDKRTRSELNPALDHIPWEHHLFTSPEMFWDVLKCGNTWWIQIICYDLYTFHKML